jgi:hypothetical protein
MLVKNLELVVGNAKIITDDLGHIPHEEDGIRTARDTCSFLSKIMNYTVFR